MILNLAQKQTVTHKNEAILVITATGFGKTDVITARITHLLTHSGTLDIL